MHSLLRFSALLLLLALTTQCQSTDDTAVKGADNPAATTGEAAAQEAGAAPEPVQANAVGPGTPIAELEFRQENGAERVYHNGQPFNGLGYSEYANGQRFTEQTYESGIQNGAWGVYYENGQRQKQGTKANATDHDVYYEWYEMGALKYEYHYDGGLKVDVWKSWYENGQQWTERHWQNDALHGKVLVWDTSGKLTKEYVYQNGKQVSAKQYLDE